MHGSLGYYAITFLKGLGINSLLLLASRTGWLDASESLYVFPLMHVLVNFLHGTPLVKTLVREGTNILHGAPASNQNALDDLRKELIALGTKLNATGSSRAAIA